MRTEQAAPETKGVTVKLLAALDLGPEIEGMVGRQLRMRMVTIEPGGVFGPIHDHQDRPGMVYILQGTITDHRDGVTKEYGPGTAEANPLGASTAARVAMKVAGTAAVLVISRKVDHKTARVLKVIAFLAWSGAAIHNVTVRR